jgi:putative methyltransferase (TIGR04325 family)
LESTLKVKNGEAVFERDSFIFDEIQYSWGVLASLFKVAVENGNSLKVLDFGGALGSHYFQNKKFLQPIKIKKWTVVEQKHYIDVGNKKIADGILSFAYSIEDVNNADVLILSAVLQYFPNPYEWLEKFIAKKIPYIVLDRTAFSTEGRDRLTLQKVPPEIYEAQYPAWFLDKSKVFSVIQKEYELIAEFQDTIDVIEEIPSEYKGALFRLKNESII